ncbi:hypothetical protein AB1Y20_013007 [Prymnesium parvum]|uniref:Kinesin light chain n=1 Tax=Prymnesium parvum TaxID=97485 RepID=A0AB34IK71_PRYPA
MLPTPFHAQVGNRSRTSEALSVASSMFYEGMEKFAAGELPEALELFEGCLSINQKYLTPSSSGTVLCYNNIAAVHDRLGNLAQAEMYYERARAQLSSKQLPQSERGPISRRKRAELLRHIEQKLDMLPRTSVPKVGVGVPISEVRNVFASLLTSGEKQAAVGELEGARLSFEQALSLSRTQLAHGKPRDVADVAHCLGQLGDLFARQGLVAQAEAHYAAAVDVLEGGGGAAVDGRLGVAQMKARLAALRAARGGAPSEEVPLVAHANSSPLPVTRMDGVAPVLSIECLPLVISEGQTSPPANGAAPAESAGPSTPPASAPQRANSDTPWSECSSSMASTPGMVGVAAESLSMAVQSATAAVEAAVAAREAAKSVHAQDALISQPDEPTSSAVRAIGEEFDWREGQEEDDGGGPLDDRVEGAIERINESRDAMNREQLALDLARQELRGAEAHTATELARLAEENKVHLNLLVAYEEQKRAAAEASAAAERGNGERERARATKAESLRMAMSLQKTFDALIPYFVYRTVLEQQLEEKRNLVNEAQQRVRAAKRAYHMAMDALEAISLDIQRAESTRKAEAMGEESASHHRNGGGHAEEEQRGDGAPSPGLDDSLVSGVASGMPYEPERSNGVVGEQVH